MHLSSPFSDSGNRTAYKICLKLSVETKKKTQANQGRSVANIAEQP